jgi:adenylate kinase
LDGFPRTLVQAEALDKLLDQKNKKLDTVIEFKVDDQVLATRVEKRAKETLAAGGTVRPDDNADALRVRLMAYYRETSPLIGYYFAKKKLKSVDGMAPIADVTRAIDSLLGAHVG